MSEHALLLIDADATCGVLSMSPRRLWSLSVCGAVPSFKIGKSRRYSPTELAAWVRAGCPTEPGAGDRIRKTIGGAA